MEVFFYNILASILAGLLKVIDFIESFFNVFAGITPVLVKSGSGTTEETDLLQFFLGNETIGKVFFTIILIALGLLGILTAYALIRNAVTLKKTNGKIVGQFLMSIFSFFLVTSVTLMGITVANFTLNEVNNAFQTEQATTLGERLFITGAESGNAWRYEGAKENVNVSVMKGRDIIGYYKENAFGWEKIEEPLDNKRSYRTVFAEIKTSYVEDYAADKVEEIRNIITFTLENGDEWQTLYNEAEATFDEYVAEDVFRYAVKEMIDSGDYGNFDYIEIEPTLGEQDSTINTPKLKGSDLLTGWEGYLLNDGYVVRIDYSAHKVAVAAIVPQGLINPLKYDWALVFIAAIVLLVVLAMSALSLTKRLFDIVFLMFSMPFTVATIPADDGSRFKLWKDTMISKVILAYGTILAVNLFLLVLPLITQITFFKESVLNIIAQLFLILGGAASIYGGQLLFARIFGTSADESREMMNLFRGAGMLGRAAVGSAKLLGGVGKAGIKVAKKIGSSKPAKAIGGKIKEGVYRGTRGTKLAMARRYASEQRRGKLEAKRTASDRLYKRQYAAYSQHRRAEERLKSQDTTRSARHTPVQKSPGNVQHTTTTVRRNKK